MQYMPIITQLIGWLGTATFLISYQMRSNRRLFLLQITASAFFCLQFVLMNAWSGSLSLFVCILRCLMMSRYDQWSWVRSKKWILVYIVAFSIILAVTWAGPISLLSYTASVVTTVAYWTNNAGYIRLSNLLCASPCWIVYDILVGSWAGVANEALTLFSILISIKRFGLKSLLQNT